MVHNCTIAYIAGTPTFKPKGYEMFLTGTSEPLGAGWMWPHLVVAHGISI